MKIPSQITAGDSVSWNDDSSYDNLGNTVQAPDYTLAYEIKGPTTLTLTGTTYATGWQTTLSAAASNALTPGTYFWQAYATNVADNTKRVTLGSGRITIAPNFANVTAPYDGSTQNEKDLLAVQAAIRAMISGGAVQDYSIAGRSVRKMAMADLLTLESKLKYRVSREQKAASIQNGTGDPHKLLVRFGK